MAKLHFYFSVMNAGKSTNLLQSAYNYQERGMEVMIFTPAIDTRYGSNRVSSRIGLQAVAVSFGSQFDLFHSVSQQLLTQKLSCILVDEAQFLTKAQVYQLTEIADQLNIPVLAYGLRSDYMGEPFEGSKYLLAWAEELNEIKTICHCGRKATMNVHIDAEGMPVQSGEQIVIGGNESFVATCRRHYKAGRVTHNNGIA